jgi:hypothetical protein
MHGNLLSLLDRLQNWADMSSRYAPLTYALFIAV